MRKVNTKFREPVLAELRNSAIFFGTLAQQTDQGSIKLIQTYC